MNTEFIDSTAECMVSAEESRAHLDDLFKGYIPVGSGKKISVRWQDSENWQTYDSIVSKNGYAGVLKDDVLVVDVDDYESGKLMLEAVKELGVKTRVHKTTKGWHFFFRRGPNDVSDRQTKLTPACGLGWHKEIADKGREKGNEVIVGDVDYLAGWSGAILILKVDGVTRDVVYETEEIGTCPRWLQPLQERGRTCHPITYELLGLGDGDGRNDTMNRLMGVLKNRGYSWEEAEETAWVVNNFTYSSPMDDAEFETVTRRDYYESLEINTGNGRGRPRGSTVVNGDKPGKYQHEVVGDELMEDLHIILLDGLLHVFDGKVYIRGEEYIEDELRERYPHAVDSNVTNTLSYIKSRTRRMWRNKRIKIAPPTHIAFRNGTYDTDLEELVPHDPEEVITNLIDWNYNPDAECEDVDRALDNITGGDASMRALLEEMMGYCLYRENSSRGKFFVLLGDKSNGKSTILKPLRKMLGENNVSGLPIQKLDGRFDTATMYHKLANIHEDIPNTYMDQNDVLKQIVTGDSLQAEEKNKTPFSFIPCCKLIFAANEMPKTKDPTGAVAKRLIPIPFDVTFGPDMPNWDPKIDKKITTEQAMERWVKLAVDGLMRYLNNGENFTEYESAKDLLEEIDRDNNPLRNFVDEALGGNIGIIIGQSTRSVYDDYYLPWFGRWSGKKWGDTAMYVGTFSKKLCSTCNLKTIQKKIDGKNVQAFAWKG